MKQKDITLVLVCVFIAGILSYFICSQFIGGSIKANKNVEVVTPISAEFTLPDKAIFNTEAIDPTQVIEIGPNSNSQPFVNR